MSLLDEARKPQERKEADVVFGTKEDSPKTGYEAVCTGIFHKLSEFGDPPAMNVYVTGTLDDGKTLLVLGQTKVLREEIAASGLAIGTRFAVVHVGYGEKKPGRKPPRIDRFITEGAPAEAGSGAEIPDEAPF